MSVMENDLSAALDPHSLGNLPVQIARIIESYRKTDRVHRVELAAAIDTEHGGVLPSDYDERVQAHFDRMNKLERDSDSERESSED